MQEVTSPNGLKKRPRGYVEEYDNIFWKQWKNKTGRKKQLNKLGVNYTLIAGALGSNSYWRLANVIGPTLTNKVLFKHYNLIDMESYYKEKHKERRDFDRIYNLQPEFVF